MATVPQIYPQIMAAIKKKDIKAAARMLKSAEKMYPNNPYILFEKGLLEGLKKSDKKTVILPLFEKAYEGLKDYADFLLIYGKFLYEFSDLGYDMLVLRLFNAYLKQKPGNTEVLIRIAIIFYRTGNLVSAINTSKMLLEKEPQNLYARNTLANALTDSGFHIDASQQYEKVMEYAKDNPLFASNHIYSTNYFNMDKKEQFELHRKYAHLWEKDELPPRPPFPQTQKIKVGFVSSDFHNHAVSHFTRGLFESYDKSKFEFILFANSQKFDIISKIIKDLIDKWHDIYAMKTDKVAELVRQEQITALIDLNGHTGKNSLALYGLRPAPLQITYCGYPNTTGLKSIDYRITDNICEPEDAQNYYSEKLYKMKDCFLCYRPNGNAQEINFEPLGNRPIIFGSFNNLRKLTKYAIKLWAKVVNSVPGSKLVIKYKSMNDPTFRKLILGRFAESGLSSDNLILLDYNVIDKDHFAEYNKVDIAFDSFPYNGTTTTCDALYMGVPVITILGDRHVSRVSASLLNAVGLGELVAKDEDEFVRIAIDLAKNTEKLTAMKTNLRNNMENSVLMDKVAFAAKFQNAILEMIEEVKKE